MRRVRFLIIGAGPTGLGACYRLQELGADNFLVLERNSFVGGLAASFTDSQGFTWDVGGHVQFSHYKYFDQAMEQALRGDQWLHHQRESWVWIQQNFVPYPFQNNIRYLPRDTMWRCLKGLIASRVAPAGAAPANFEQWIRASFGDGIAEEFMLPYNFKVWAFPPRQLAFNWIGERVATVDLERLVENVVYEKTDRAWGPNNTFSFPLTGGTGAIWNSIARRVGLSRILCGNEVRGIDPVLHTVTLADGQQIQYEFLLSTMPLNLLAAMVRNVPSSIVSRASELKYSSTNIVGIGVKGRCDQRLASKCWMYFPEADCPYCRVTVFSNYSPHNAPSSLYYSLMCEVSESAAKPVDRKRVINDTIDGLIANGFLDRSSQIVSRWSYATDYGYPTPCLERDRILSDVIPYLEQRGVFSRGRFGGWKYEVSNQDHSFMQGVEWVNRVLDNQKETTYTVR